jgi:hypothetical protein
MLVEADRFNLWMVCPLPSYFPWNGFPPVFRSVTRHRNRYQYPHPAGNAISDCPAHCTVSCVCDAVRLCCSAVRNINPHIDRMEPRPVIADDGPN